jgi:uncharacterized protein with ParB-like and HNH nuclease domain
MAANNLLELFSSRIFRTPDYQRGYAWGEKQLSELWDDLEEIPVEEDGEYKKHYTGTIFLKETLPDSDEKWLQGVKFYDVVDGQQRLTTITILLFELLKATDNGYCGESKEDLIKTFIVKVNQSGASKIYKFSYAKTNQNYQFLLHSIYENQKEILPVNYKNLYTENLEQAKSFFKDKIALLSSEGKEILYRKITTSLLFDIRTIENDLDVQAVFETMNNRGKPLSILEKLKNRLIYLTVKLPNNPQEDRERLREKINEAWGKVYTCLAKNPCQVLDEDIFLSAHLSLYRKPDEFIFSERAAEEKVFQMFCNKAEKFDEDVVSYSKIEDYILKLSELAPIWYEIHNTNSKILKKILTMDSRKEIKIFLAAVILDEFENKEEIFLDIEKILFRNRVPGIWLMDERNMANWARDIYLKDRTADEILNDINKYLNPINITDTIKIVNGFKDLFTYERGNKGFHRWWTLKYFLFEYEDHLKNTKKETDDKVTLDDFAETTIEHIIPQQFCNNWKEEVEEVTNTMEDEGQIWQAKKVLINTLGNLTILKNGKNASLGDRSWEEKRERFRTGSYNEIIISKNEHWNKSTIKARGIDLLKFLETKVSGLKFSDEDMNRILFYDDYIIKRI